MFDAQGAKSLQVPAAYTMPARLPVQDKSVLQCSQPMTGYCSALLQQFSRRSEITLRRIAFAAR
jgi:hypothetical protein